MTPMRLGVMPQEALRARTLAIARGEQVPSPEDPKVWFTSVHQLAEVLSDENRALLQVMAEHPTLSLSALAAHVGRAPSNLSRTLSTLEQCGIVRKERAGRRVYFVVLATRFVVVL